MGEGEKQEMVQLKNFT